MSLFTLIFFLALENETALPYQGGVGGIKPMQLTDHHHLPYNPKLVQRAKELRKNMTKAERKLWYDYLRNFKYRVHRQRPIDQFIVDFYCFELKLVIEIDGDSAITFSDEMRSPSYQILKKRSRIKITSIFNNSD